MIYLCLFTEFFYVGLFSVGGGLATIPFLSEVGMRTGWFSQTQLADVIAISESTPGPIGVNMATYTGFLTAGPAGSVVATMGLVMPSVIIILIIARLLQRFRQSKYVDAVFYGLRAASVALITAAGISVARIALFSPLSPKAILLAVIVFICMQLRPLKRLHPAVFIALSAAVGIIFQY